jgi:hypothetical protein
MVVIFFSFFSDIISVKSVDRGTIFTHLANLYQKLISGKKLGFINPTKKPAALNAEFLLTLLPHHIFIMPQSYYEHLENLPNNLIRLNDTEIRWCNQPVHHNKRSLSTNVFYF